MRYSKRYKRHKSLTVALLLPFAVPALLPSMHAMHLNKWLYTLHTNVCERVNAAVIQFTEFFKFIKNVA